MTALFAYTGRIKAPTADRWRLVYAGHAILTVALALMVWRTAPTARPLSLTVLVLCSVAVLAKPMLGVYVIAFFALLGDYVVAGWFPFTKNFSSYESALFIHDAVILSPLDLMIVLTFCAWALHAWGGRFIPVARHGLFRPVLVFGGLVSFALLYGLLRGGNSNIALWEVRPILYLPLMYILCSSLLSTGEQYRRLMTTIVVALLLEAIHARYVIGTLSGSMRQFAGLMGFLEHSASLHFNSVFVLMVAAWIFRARSNVWRVLLPVTALAIIPVYLLAERRSAVVALIAAAILLTPMLFKRRRAVAWIVAPITIVIVVAYLAAFWNVEGGVGFPAQAVKSVLAPEQLSVADQNSDLYRRTETYNLVATIRAHPLFGTGFGHPFLQILALPYIPFIWAQYMPHNSFLWIWINTGIAGFLAMLWLFATTVIRGVHATLRLSGYASAITLSSTLFVVMYVVFSYVDIAWDTQSMLYLAVCLAAINFFAGAPATLHHQPSLPSDHLPKQAGPDVAVRGT